MAKKCEETEKSNTPKDVWARLYNFLRSGNSLSGESTSNSTTSGQRSEEISTGQKVDVAAPTSVNPHMKAGSQNEVPPAGSQNEIPPAGSHNGVPPTAAEQPTQEPFGPSHGGPSAEHPSSSSSSGGTENQTGGAAQGFPVTGHFHQCDVAFNIHSTHNIHHHHYPPDEVDMDVDSAEDSEDSQLDSEEDDQ